MLRTLSTPATALLKFVLPPLWIGAVGYAVSLLWMDPQRAFDDANPAGANLALRWLLLALFAGSLLVMWAFVLPLKRVRLGADGLRVSNYAQEITVPFNAIARVQQNWLPTFRLITVDLRTQTPLGQRLIFMPAVRRRMAFWRSDYWTEDEMVRELRSLAGLPNPEDSRMAAV